MFQHACPLHAVYMQFVVFVLGFAVLLQYMVPLKISSVDTALFV